MWIELNLPPYKPGSQSPSVDQERGYLWLHISLQERIRNLRALAFKRPRFQGHWTSRILPTAAAIQSGTRLLDGVKQTVCTPETRARQRCIGLDRSGFQIQQQQQQGQGAVRSFEYTRRGICWSTNKPEKREREKALLEALLDDRMSISSLHPHMRSWWKLVGLTVDVRKNNPR